MNKTNVHQALEIVARNHEESLENVIFCINTAIRDAYSRNMQANEQLAHSLWDKIPFTGDIPDAVELLQYLASNICSGVDTSDHCMKKSDS